MELTIEKFKTQTIINNSNIWYMFDSGRKEYIKYETLKLRIHAKIC